MHRSPSRIDTYDSNDNRVFYSKPVRSVLHRNGEIKLRTNSKRILCWGRSLMGRTRTKLEGGTRVSLCLAVWIGCIHRNQRLIPDTFYISFTVDSTKFSWCGSTGDHRTICDCCFVLLLLLMWDVDGLIIINNNNKSWRRIDPDWIPTYKLYWRIDDEIWSSTIIPKIHPWIRKHNNMIHQ